jgi:hypothetical protein
VKEVLAIEKQVTSEMDPNVVLFKMGRGKYPTKSGDKFVAKMSTKKFERKRDAMNY